jgi:hypothetical protein
MKFSIFLYILPSHRYVSLRSRETVIKIKTVFVIESHSSYGTLIKSSVKMENIAHGYLIWNVYLCFFF